jgi:YfiH family protein
LNLEFIIPDWPAPPGIHALTTTRRGGVSLAPYDSLNLGDHVGDAPEAVAENRRRLVEALSLPAEPRWLSQVHGTCAANAAKISSGCEADASHTDRPGVVCAVLTADCLPLLLCDRDGRHVAAVHAGWRGLLNGVIEKAIEAMGAQAPLLAWLGPAIGPQAFEVGEEVRQAFIEVDAAAASAFKPSPGGRWLADIYALARLRLQAIGVGSVHGGQHCTYSEPERFYSYRRDAQTGRMASLIWIGDNTH